MIARIFLCLLLLTTAAEARCYDARVTRVYDGDTIWVDVYLGFNVEWSNKSVRILDIDAPEVWLLSEREEGERVRDILIEKIGGQEIEICTEDRELDSFGRILAHVFHDGVNIGQWMVDEGLVLPYE